MNHLVSTSTQIRRVTLPRWEVDYADPTHAHTDLARLRDRKVLQLDHALPGELGSEVVLDLRVSGVTSEVTLLFRIIQRHAAITIFELWARRASDPLLLAAFVEAVRAHGPTPGAGAAPAPPSPELTRLLATCRRALSRNPFQAVGIHWTAGEAAADDGVAKTRADLEELRASRGLSPEIHALVTQALTDLPRAAQVLSSLEGRRNARATFVPTDQLQHARELVETKLDVARMRGDATGLIDAQHELNELRVSRQR